MRQPSACVPERSPPTAKTCGFTLIELVMVILLLAILSAVAIPNFIDYRVDAKNAATKGALGAMRAALAIATASIALREDPAVPTPKYPDMSEMQQTSLVAMGSPPMYLLNLPEVTRY